MGIFKLNQNRLSVITQNNNEDINWALIDQILNIGTITPISFTGVAAGTEFLTYAITKMYLGLQVECSYTSLNLAAANGRMDFFDNANAQIFTGGNCSSVWDVVAAAAKYSILPYVCTNIVFSRFSLTTYTQIKFIGYRITT